MVKCVISPILAWGLLALFVAGAFGQSPEGGFLVAGAFVTSQITINGPLTCTQVNGATICSASTVTTPSPAPTATPTPSPSPTPPAEILPSVCQGTVYYVAANGNDANTGLDSQHPWQTPAHAYAQAQPFEGVLFRGGDVFSNFQWTMTKQDEGRCLSSYGMGRAIFDGGGTLPWAVGEFSSNTSPPLADNITVDSLEIRHYTQMGIVFANNNGGQDGTLQNINVTNNLIYDVGPGCAMANGPCVGSDPGGYLNTIDLLDSHVPTTRHIWTVSGNTVKWVGGHNAIQVHFDTGPTQVTNNVVGPGCVHGCIDVKGSGSATDHAVVQNNTSGCGLSKGLCGDAKQSTCYYTENPYNTAGSYIDFSNNKCADSPIGYQACAGSCSTGPNCPLNLTYTTNTATSTPSWALYLGNGGCGSGSTSTATATLSGNNWNGGKVNNGFAPGH